METDETPAAMFLRWHYKLNHLSPRKMTEMVKAKLLPSKLLKCEPPLCPSCLFGKATRRSWRVKPNLKGTPSKLRNHTLPGQCVSVDQLESTTPGLIAQMKGWLTKKRYKVATIFVDHFSGLSFLNLQTSTSGEETLEAKVRFERFATRSGVKILHYHADNGRFADNLFREHVANQGQTMTFCGVNAHFQNSVAERRIRLLQDNARAMLIHAQARWKQAITANLWPYALRLANDVFNSTPEAPTLDKRSPAEKFHSTPVRPNLRFFQPFGCPAYVLDNALQAGSKLPKWDMRARIGVALVLNITTGHVSPQFHIKFDPTFRTLDLKFGGVNPMARWMQEA